MIMVIVIKRSLPGISTITPCPWLQVILEDARIYTQLKVDKEQDSMVQFHDMVGLYGDAEFGCHHVSINNPSAVLCKPKKLIGLIKLNFGHTIIWSLVDAHLIGHSLTSSWEK